MRGEKLFLALPTGGFVRRAHPTQRFSVTQRGGGFGKLSGFGKTLKAYGPIFPKHPIHRKNLFLRLLRGFSPATSPLPHLFTMVGDFPANFAAFGLPQGVENQPGHPLAGG